MNQTIDDVPVQPVSRLVFDGPRGPLFSALAEARKHYLPLHADSDVEVQLKGGGGYKHAYADLATVIKALTPGWVAAGLAVMQFIDGDQVTTVVGCGESSVSISCPIPGYDTAQQMGSGTTYIRRYQLKAVFVVNDAEDDDGNEAAGNTAAVTKRAPSVSKSTSALIPEGLAKEITAAAKANELSRDEFYSLVQKQTGKTWDKCDETDARKVLGVLKGDK